MAPPAKDYEPPKRHFRFVYLALVFAVAQGLTQGWMYGVREKQEPILHWHHKAKLLRFYWEVEPSKGTSAAVKKILVNPKYSGKEEQLYSSLQKKYGVPVREPELTSALVAVSSWAYEEYVPKENRQTLSQMWEENWEALPMIQRISAVVVTATALTLPGTTHKPEARTTRFLILVVLLTFALLPLPPLVTEGRPGGSFADVASYVETWWNGLESVRDQLSMVTSFAFVALLLRPYGQRTSVLLVYAAALLWILNPAHSEACKAAGGLGVTDGEDGGCYIVLAGEALKACQTPVPVFKVLQSDCKVTAK